MKFTYKSGLERSLLFLLKQTIFLKIPYLLDKFKLKNLSFKHLILTS